MFLTERLFYLFFSSMTKNYNFIFKVNISRYNFLHSKIFMINFMSRKLLQNILQSITNSPFGFNV